MSARATRSAAGRQNLPAAALRRQICACFGRRLARKTVVFHGFASRPRFCIATAKRAWRSVTCAGVFHVVFRQRFERQNPFALWQSLQQPDSSASNSAQSDPIGSLLAALGQGQGTATGATASSGGAGSSSTSSAVTSGSSSPQFGAQTLQTMFDMQANAANSQSAQSPARWQHRLGQFIVHPSRRSRAAAITAITIT